MALFEDDDEGQNFRFEDAAQSVRRGQGKKQDDSWDRDEVDDSDPVPDAMEMVRCGHCGKLVLEDSYRCPYCKHLQLEEERSRTARWVFITALVCLAAVGLYFLAAVMDIFYVVSSMTQPLAEWSRRGHFRRWWIRAAWLVPALAFFVWAGGAADPRAALPWGWTTTGWLVPAAGLGMFWIASALLFWLLSEIAWLLFHPVAGSLKLRDWVSAAIVLLLAAAVRIAIVVRWAPLEGAEAGLEGLPAAALRWLPMLADLALVGLLLLVLYGAQRSLWWAALYALHPLVLMEVAGAGHWIGLVMLPVVFGVGVSHRWGWKLRGLVTGLAGAGGVIVVALVGMQARGFDSLPLDVARSFGGSGRVALPLAAAILEAIVIALAVRRGWPLGKALGHVLMVFILCSPAVYPWFGVAVLALLPLAWNRAGWVFSLLAMGTYAAVLSQGTVPEWLLVMMWVPVIVVEIADLWGEAAGVLGAGASAAVEAGVSYPDSRL